MRHQQALVALAVIAMAAAATIAGAQTAAQNGATVANEVGNPIGAPETVDPGQQVDVSVSGAAEGAMIELWGPVTQSGTGERIGATPLTGGTATIAAPEVAASYQLRHVAANGSVRARRAFEVAASPVMLEVPVEANAGAGMQVSWRGPAKTGDTLQIVDPATGTVLQSMPVAGEQGARNVSQLPVPDHSGMVELRYVTAGGTVLRTIPFQVRRLGG